MAEVRARRRRRLLATSIAAAVALVVGGGYAASARSSVPGDLRVASVTTGPVTQTLSLTGTARHVSQVTAAFPTTGNVTSVRVTVGERVTAGQVLATLDPAALQSALKSAQATLAQDRAALAADQSAGASSAASPSTAQQSGSTGRWAASGRSGSATGRPGGATPRIDTSTLQKALEAASEASTTAATACARVFGTASGPAGPAGSRSGAPSTSRSSRDVALTGTPTPPPTGSTATRTGPGSPGTTTTAPAGPSPTTTTAAAGPSPTTTPVPTHTAPAPPTTGTPPRTASPGPTGPSVQQLQACATALQDVRRAQQRAARSLATVSARLTKVVTQVEQTATAAAQDVTRSTGSAAGSSNGTGGHPQQTGTGQAAVGLVGQRATSGAAAGAGSTDQATRVAGDEVAILQDEASVGQAQADLDGATLTAPIAGVVGQVGLTTGQSATPQSGIVVIGGGAVDVTVDVPLADLPLVKAGLSAEVTPAGAVSAVKGHVSEVDLLPATSGSSTPAYPARVVVSDPPASMPTGSTATVTVEVATAQNVLRVPVSAVAGVTGQTGTVTTVTNGTTRAAPVTIGAVGGGWAQVVRGVAAGDQVLLADPNTPLPSNNAAGLRGIGAGGGGFVRRSPPSVPGRD